MVDTQGPWGEGWPGCCCDATPPPPETCLCYCERCAETGAGNAPCCWAIQIDGVWYYMTQQQASSGEEDCSWSGVLCDCTSGEGEISLWIGEESMILTICETEYEELLTTPPNCCQPLKFNNDQITVYPSTNSCCNFAPRCLQLTITGVENTCDCAACATINGSYSLQWTGTGYEGDLCNATHQYDRCHVNLTRGWNVCRVSVSGCTAEPSELTITASIASVEVINSQVNRTGYVYWTGAYDAESGSYLLEYVSGGTPTCDFSGSTATVVMGPTCPPCGESAGCEEVENRICGCKDNAFPRYLEITIPGSGFLNSFGWEGDRTFLIPFAGNPTTCYNILTVGTLGCEGPYSILFDGSPWSGYPFRVQIEWRSTPTTQLGLLTFWARWPSGTTPDDYCDGDSNTKFDCATLYSLSLELLYKSQFVSAYACGSSIWNSAVLGSLEAVP